MMPEPGMARSTTVLLVDDDEDVRKYCRDSLAQDGFTVLEGDNGFEALLVAAHYDGVIAILITDLDMPRISGIQLAYAFRKLQPTASVLYISGCAHQSLGAQLRADCAFLPKPFLPAALVTKIKEVLDARAPR